MNQKSRINEISFPIRSINIFSFIDISFIVISRFLNAEFLKNNNIKFINIFKLY